MTAASRFQKLICIFAIVYLFLEPRINVIGIDVQPEELEKNLPHEYKIALAADSPFFDHIWLNHSMRYSKGKDNVLSIIFSGPYERGWLGMGFSKNGRMVGSSAMVGWAGDEKGKTFIKQYSIEGDVAEKIIPDKGALQIINGSSVSLVLKDTFHLAFQIKFPPKNLVHKVILASSPDPPDANSKLTHHKQKKMIEIDFDKAKLIEHALEKATHGVLGLLAWQVIIPLGILFPVYFKHRDNWFFLHVPFQIVAYIFTLITALMGFRLSSKLVLQLTWHKYFGFVVLTLSSYQMLSLIARPSKESKLRNIWRLSHRIIGYTVAFLGFLNVYLGIRLADAGPGWTIVYFAMLVFYGTLFLTLGGREEQEQLEAPVFNLIMKT